MSNDKFSKLAGRLAIIGLILMIYYYGGKGIASIITEDDEEREKAGWLNIWIAIGIAVFIILSAFGSGFPFMLFWVLLWHFFLSLFFLIFWPIVSGTVQLIKWITEKNDVNNSRNEYQVVHENSVLPTRIRKPNFGMDEMMEKLGAYKQNRYLEAEHAKRLEAMSDEERDEYDREREKEEDRKEKEYKEEKELLEEKDTDQDYEKRPGLTREQMLERYEAWKRKKRFIEEYEMVLQAMTPEEREEREREDLYTMLMFYGDFKASDLIPYELGNGFDSSWDDWKVKRYVEWKGLSMHGLAIRFRPSR